MIELPVTLTSTGGAVSFASPVTLGYTKNKGVYRLLITAEGEWQGLAIRCFWHLPGGTDPASSLVQDGFVDVPASVTAQPGTGCITFEGSDGEKTVTSADLRYKVGSNSGTEDGTMPEPGAPAWEQFVSETKANADAAEQAKNDAQAAAEGVKTAAAKADEAASAAAKSAQKAEEAQKATEQAEAAAAESIAGAKKEALNSISAGEQDALGAVQQAQTTATGAVQAAQTAAESAVSTAKTNAVQEVEAASKPAQAAATKAEEAAERSMQAGIAASNAADDAAGSAVAAGNAASAAAKSAQAALESKTAAETSEGNAAASAKKAQDVADSLPADYMTAVNEIAALKINKADKADLETVRKQIGNLDDLTTKAKETLVAAINEAARTGAAMRTDGVYIQYSTDDGSTWENLIALAELKGEPGQNGADGAPGADGYSPTASVDQSTDGAKITITDKSGTTEAQVLNGKDGQNGTDGAPGRDGVDGQPGKDGTDGITPTIGDNGNWFLGVTDTGKPSRGATGDTGTDGKDAPQINDTAITTTNPWSSKHIIDMLCPPLEETGNTVVCYPVAGYPLGVKASWEPVQEGSGTPYPAGGGKNLWGDLLQNTFVSQQGLSSGYSGAKATGKIPCTEGDNYTLSCATTFAPAPGNIGVLAYFDASDTMLTRVANTYQRAFTLTAPANVAYLRASCYKETDADNVQLEKGSAATAYAPYANIRPIKGRDSVTITRQEDNQVITLTLPETVYGGEVDAVTGGGNEKAKIITLDGNELKFSQGPTYYNLPFYSAPGILARGIICCSHFNRTLFGVNTSYEFCFLLKSDIDGLFASANDLNAYLATQYAAGTPVQICYKLKEPVPFTATGAQPIPALAGANTVITDADSVDVTGRADADPQGPVGKNAELPLIYDFTTTEEARWIDTGNMAFACSQEIIIELTAVATATNTADNKGCASIYTASTSIELPWRNYFIDNVDGMLPKQYSRYFVAHGRKGAGGGWLVDFTIRTTVNGGKVPVYRTFWTSGVFVETITGIIIGDASAQSGTRVLGAGTKLRIFGV